MKKLLSLFLAMAMLVTIVPAFAESTTKTSATTSSESSGLSSLFGGLMGSEGKEGGLGSLLGGLMSGEGKEGGLSSLLGGIFGKDFNLNALLQSLIQRLRSLKGAKLTMIITALKQKLNGLVSGLSGLFGSSSRSTEGSESGESAGLSSLLGLLGGMTEGSEGGESADLSSLLGGLLGGATEESEGIDSAELLGLLSLLGSEDGESSESDFDLDAFLEEYMKTPEYQDFVAKYDAIQAHLLEEYAEGLEKGDVQIFDISDISSLTAETDPNKFFAYMSLSNYKVDGKDLKMMNYAGNVELLTLEKQADGTYKVLSYVVAEDGTEQAASIQKMCDEYGVTYDNYTEAIMWNDWSDLFEMVNYMKEHPEYERMEYMGEMKTLEELSTRLDTLFDETMALYNTPAAK